MNSKSNIRVSIKSHPCQTCHCRSVSPPCTPKKCGPTSEYYVQQLKKEIQHSKDASPRHDEEYVNKLKEELMVQKAKCLDDARNMINELQNEILNYRIQAKNKFTPSPVDVCGDKAEGSLGTQKSGPHVPKTQIGDNVVHDSHHPEGTPGCKPCETLWKSRSSFPSSTDLGSGPIVQDINFEEKLQEANSLIEKVRSALKDIGRGIYKVPEQKRVSAEPVPIKGCEQVPMKGCGDDPLCKLQDCGSCLPTDTKCKDDDKAIKKLEEKKESKAGIPTKKKEEKKRDTSKPVQKKQEDKPKTPQEYKRKKPAQDEKPKIIKSDDHDEQKKTVPSEEPKLVQNDEEKVPQDETENKSITDDTSSLGKDDRPRITPEEIEEIREILKKNENPKEIITIKPVSESDIDQRQQIINVLNDNDVSESLLLLQEKLNTISEISESDTDRTDARKKYEVSSTGKMERGSSPIDLTAFLYQPTDQRKASDTVSGSVNNPSSSDIKSFLEQVSQKVSQQQCPKRDDIQAEHTQTTPGLKRSGPGSYRSEDEECSVPSRKTSEKASKLSIQMMPPVHIRGGLVMQRTLNLSIRPTGSATNNIVASRSNVAYEEVKADSGSGPIEEPIFIKCPDECKNELGGYCKYKFAKDGEGGEVPSIGVHEPLIFRASQSAGPSAQISVSQAMAPDQIISKESEVIQKPILKPSASHPSRGKLLSGGLTEDALILFRSFQILDDNTISNAMSGKGSQLSMSGIPRRKRLSIAEGETPIPSSKRTESEKSYSTSHDGYRSDSGSATPRIGQTDKSPWEIGFYKTKSTQISRTSLYPEDESERGKQTTSDEMPKTSSIEASPRIPSSSSSDTSGDTPFTNIHSSFNDQRKREGEEVPKESKANEDEESFRRTSKESPLEKTSAASIEIPVKDIKEAQIPMHPITSIKMSDIINALHDTKDITSVSHSVLSSRDDFPQSKQRISITLPEQNVPPLSEPAIETLRKSFTEPPKRSLSESRKKPPSGSSNSSSSSSNGKKKHKSKDKPQRRKSKSSTKSSDKNSTTSSSSSSYSNGYTRAETSPPPSVQSAGAKRPRDTSLDSEKSSINTVKGPTEGKLSEPFAKMEVKDSVNKKPKPKEHHENHEAPKNGKPPPPGRKTDKNIQVSLSSGSEDSSTSSLDPDKEETSAVACFIKGLTGTSQEQLEKLRSNPSFPKSDLQTWSAAKLKTMQEQSEQTDGMSKRSIFEVTREEQLGSHDYVDKSPPEEHPSNVSTLSERSKMKRLQEFQRMAQSSMKRKNGDGKDKVVMTLVEEKGDGGEGDERPLSFSKRHLPFYRRVLGRILEPSVRKSMKTSHSDPYPVEESISEGEIKCRSSASIGELQSFRYAIDRKKMNKGASRYMKKHPDDLMGDKSLRIARQRTQYNNWVTYYLQKHHHVSLINDSTSTSVSCKK